MLKRKGRGQIGDLERVLIIGAGKFGTRAVHILSNERGLKVWVVDQDPERLRAIQNSCEEAVLAEGVQFLVDHKELFSQGVIIVPALPVHLAYMWLRKAYSGPGALKSLHIPDELLPAVSFRMRGDDGIVYLSHADFPCPDDCPEPSECTVTGQRRKPLYEILEALEGKGFGVSIIKSRQLAPGVGGYSIKELSSLSNKVVKGPEKKWIVATSCKCHGVLSAFEILD